MSFTRPSLVDLRQRTANDLNSRLAGTDALLRRSNTNVLATVHAGASHGMYGRLEYLAAQLMPDTAEAEYLLRWASIWGVSPKSATFAAGQVQVLGVDGSVIEQDAELQRQDGIIYIVQAEAVIVDGTATLQVVCADPGTIGNAIAGTLISFIIPVDGVESQTVSGAITGGIDAESDANLLVRLLKRIQYPPHGGASGDYIDWALEVTGVTRAWCLPNWLGVGTVGVTFVCDDQAGTIVPTTEKVAEVAAYIEDHIDPASSRRVGRPVTAEVTVFAPVLRAHDLTLHLVPDSATNRANVTAELADLYRREAEPGGIILLSWINEAISVATGETDHKVLSQLDDFRPDRGEIATLGTISWA